MDGTSSHISPSIPPDSERSNKLYNMVVDLSQNKLHMRLIPEVQSQQKHKSDSQKKDLDQPQPHSFIPSVSYLSCPSADGVLDVSLKPRPYRSLNSKPALFSAPLSGTDNILPVEDGPSFPIFWKIVLDMSRDNCWTEASLR